MAHFAQIDDDGFVQRVIVISNDDIINQDGDEEEALGITVCKTIFGPDTNWVQTSYNNRFRKQYAGIGMKFDFEKNLFFHPTAPYPSWVLDEQNDWIAPFPKPNSTDEFYWDEDSLSWIQATLSFGE
jgi:hypothetical protein